MTQALWLGTLETRSLWSTPLMGGALRVGKAGGAWQASSSMGWGCPCQGALWEPEAELFVKKVCLELGNFEWLLLG